MHNHMFHVILFPSHNAAPDPTERPVVTVRQQVIGQHDLSLGLPRNALIIVVVISISFVISCATCVVCLAMRICGHSQRRHVVKGPDVVNPLYTRLPSGEEYAIPIDRKWEFHRGKWVFGTINGFSLFPCDLRGRPASPLQSSV